MSKTVADLNTDLTKFKSEILQELESFRGQFSTDSSAGKSVEAVPSKDALNSFQNKIMRKFSKMEEDLKAFDERLDDLENYSRRNCLVVHGVPEEPREDIDAVVQDFFRTDLRLAGIDVMVHVDRCHRLGPPPPKNTKNTDGPEEEKKRRPIIIKFCSYRVRSRVWLNKKVLKGSRKVITESLTTQRIKLLQEAKKVFTMANVWTSDGRIMLKYPNGSKASVTTKAGLEEAIKKLSNFPPQGPVTRHQAQPPSQSSGQKS